jgi:hypothetical protein
MLQAQHECITDSLSVVYIKNENLLPILDGFIEHEQSCDYYNSKLLFEIHSQTIYDTTIIQVESIGYEKNRVGDELGGFVYRGHFFFVTGMYLEETIFTLTYKKKLCEYYQYEDDYNHEEKTLLIEIIDDDSFSFYVYYYMENEFHFKELHTYCD